ncbi:hypothetical protein PENSPDRAFT_756065 [Peniophora sp. CONT]|nr:hypothetical protein PENSPDRAFT_756065 [Peniophora sp. CONT]
MASSAASAGDGSKDPGGDTSQTPARISKKTIENAKSAASTAVGVLGVVAEMAENVPYLGAVSKALTTFKEVMEEVDVCKKDCRAATSEATEFIDLMGDFEKKAGSSAGGKEGELRKACKELSDAILKCLNTLQSLGVDSKRKRDRIKLLLKRGDVQSSVNECRDKMRIAKEKFNMIVAADTNRVAHEIRQHILPQHFAPPTQTVWSLRAANIIFHGRESEVEAAVGLIVQRAPARVAVLGPGGIGKTSIALTVLHDARVKDLYGDRRCFMSCEATATSDAVVRALAEALHVSLEKGCSTQTARDRVLLSLNDVSGIICLDNFETPLESDKQAVEELLNDIAALSSVAVLITSRDTSIPTIKWTSPPLAHIKPFSHDAALATWDDIFHERDEYAVKLVEAVDCMPLAVTLLARLAFVEGDAKTIWARWESEHTELIRTGAKEHRLYSVEASIDLSLKAINFQGAIDVLGMICISSGVLYNNQILKLEEGLKGHLSVRRAVTLLKQLSLVYTEAPFPEHPELQIFRVLSPIRHHVLQNHVADDVFLTLTDIVMQDPIHWDYAVTVTFGWNRPGCRERCLQMVIAFPAITSNIEMLSQAIEKARELEPHIQSRLYGQLGHALNRVREFEKARSSFSQAIELDEQMGDRQALFEDWKWWIWTFKYEFDGREDECQHLDEVQNAIQKAWELGHDESGVWDQDYNGYWDLTWAQHFVNEGRRKLHMPVVHRSGVYSGNDSTVDLGFSNRRAAYNQLLSKSPPPWDLSSILETIESTRRASSASFEGSMSPAR